ncbi:MAG: hypothetical protein Tsb0021_00550 [Chlamydiales bacterium]
MRQTTTSVQFGPEFTPNPLKHLLIATGVISLSLPFLEVLLGTFFGNLGIQKFFSLTPSVISRFYFWQPFTYFFLQQSFGGISLGLFINLAFKLYFIWIMGTSVIERLGLTSFFISYLGGAVIAAIGYMGGVLFFDSNTIFAGTTPALLSLFILWSFMNPETTLYVLLIIPIQLKWILAGVVGLALLVPLSDGEMVFFFMNVFSLSLGYFYATVAWGFSSPFPQSHKWDALLSRLGDWLILKIRWLQSKFSIHQHEDDHAFVDRILEKISKKGTNSLTWRERQRLEKISKEKK